MRLPIGSLTTNLTVMFTICLTLARRGAGGTGWATSSALAHPLKNFRHGGELAGLVGRPPPPLAPPLQGGKMITSCLQASGTGWAAPTPPGPPLQGGENDYVFSFAERGAGGTGCAAATPPGPPLCQYCSAPNVLRGFYAQIMPVRRRQPFLAPLTCPKSGSAVGLKQARAAANAAVF